MRIPLIFAALALSAAPALAQKKDGVTGDYEVKYEAVSNNCRGTGMSLTRGPVKMALEGRALRVSANVGVDMKGSLFRDGKFQARSLIGPTGIQGLDGKYSVAGRVDQGLIQFVLVAEYYQGKKPLCTQSWNASGYRADQLK